MWADLGHNKLLDGTVFMHIVKMCQTKVNVSHVPSVDNVKPILHF